jgi:hypothetical protein
MHEPRYQAQELCSVTNLTFPHRKNRPPRFSKLRYVSSISPDIPRDFGFPELTISPRQFLALIARKMSVPETTMHKDDLAFTSHHQIWLAVQAPIVGTEAIAKCSKGLPYLKF